MATELFVSALHFLLVHGQHTKDIPVGQSPEPVYLPLSPGNAWVGR